MSNIHLPPDESRAGIYNGAPAVPLKHLRSDGSVTAPEPTGVQVLPPSPERAALWMAAPTTPARYLYPDGSVWDHEPGSGGGGGSLVSPVRSGAIRNGIQLHCVSTGAVYSYFSGICTIDSPIVIEPGVPFEIADTEDFPELEWYQGDPLLETGRLLTISSDGLVDTPVHVLVGSDGIHLFNMSTSTLTLPQDAQFTFNKLLVLGLPVE